MQDILHTLYQGKNITQEQSETLLYCIIKEKLSSIQIASALISMKIRGETFEEIIGAVNVLLTHSKPFPRINSLFADITGTGGDNSNTINISTTSAIVASTCGAKIIKHGNSSISSLIGSMDLLGKYYLHIDNTPEKSYQKFNELGICFLYAPQYYEVLHRIMPIRKQLKIPTLFNIVGPLINPSKPPLTLIGVYKKELLSPIIRILQLLKYNHAIVVHCGGIDEVGLHSSTHVAELYNDIISNYVLTASDFGLNSYPIETLRCYSKKQAHEYMINTLKGKGEPAHSAVIAANVALLLKLFGHNNLHANTQLALEKMHHGIPYARLTSLSDN
ncbi:anthranilate phosphoribosyltransferase [Blochmannia endosymbiont of Camponotus sp. C-003]|uniref:anthranilate phosphoribosyltransferase n=1 Tax=unclassified Candidatus Blochmanniella TaxID=711328 RepID=UPI0020247859|nr:MULTISPECIES: anthranilate phosphoribosyltransferase [unclassified Candidatus Blochmannia]URJ23625.1 anthranilate phosphoribosyltransferase [Blochmannia endosymbiont of Camponotus sp. C-003]URJ29070.1 anthranilate phosphoribosyltransferase [Blochmannia endosymbiont of Camponotus sp. C-046]